MVLLPNQEISGPTDTMRYLKTLRVIHNEIPVLLLMLMLIVVVCRCIQRNVSILTFMSKCFLKIFVEKGFFEKQ